MRLRSSLAVLPFALLAACSLGTESSTSGAQGVAGEAAASGGDVAAPPTTPAPAAPALPAAPKDEGAVFTIGNAAEGNAVIAFARGADGTLTPAGTFATGGTGTGEGLGSQGALALSADGKFLVVVDAGSNEITSFAVNGANLTRRSRISSDGVMPVSVAIHGRLVYALNAGGTACISGYRVDDDGVLTAIAGSKHSLSTAAAAPAQIAFTPKGDGLVVTEKATDVIDTFVVRADGTTSNGEALPSAGKTPFGFAFSPAGFLVVSEAAGGAAGLGTASSYALEAMFHPGADGNPERGLVSISRAVPANTSAPCWVAISGDGKYAYTTNTASDDVSGFAVEANGALTLLGSGVSAVTGAGSRPIDMAFDASSRHLFVLNNGTDEVISFDLGAGGALVRGPASVKVPASAYGLVAR